LEVYLNITQYITIQQQYCVILCTILYYNMYYIVFIFDNNELFRTFWLVLYELFAEILLFVFKLYTNSS